jgi:hypothetical protein
MKFEKSSGKGFLICVVCIMMLVCVPSIDGGIVGNQDNEALADSPGRVKPGFIFGPYNYTTWDGDLLCLIAEWGMSPARELNFVVPFRREHLHKYEQLRLAQFDNCIFIKNFVIGFCKIYMPESEISMRIFSQDDSENEVTWEVDDITGDKVWESNIDVELYLESGARHRGYMYGPLGDEYLGIGDHIRIKLHDDDDGYYVVRFVESVSKDILFESPLTKF